MSYIYENFKLYYPNLAEKVVKYKETDKLEMIIELDDGSTVIFDDINDTIRYLPTDREEMTDEDYDREFGIRLRRLMLRSEMNQPALSSKTGITQSTLSTYINGKASPTIRKAIKIAKALDCSVDELVHNLEMRM